MKKKYLVEYRIDSTISREECWWGVVFLSYLGLEPVGG